MKPKKLKFGDRIRIRLFTQDEVKGTIERINKEKDGSRFIILRISNDVEKLIDYRKINLDIIWWEYDGLKIPNEAVIYENGLSYIVRNKMGIQEKILIKVLKQNARYAVVNNYDAEELKKMGYKMIDINNLKTISIYDEIILSPKID